MKKHTVFSRVTALALCTGMMLSGPVMAGDQGFVRDVELSGEGTLHGAVLTDVGETINGAQVRLQHQGKTVAVTTTDADGRFAITGVRAGMHHIAAGSLTTPVRLWKSGTAPQQASAGIAISGSETIIRAQSYDPYCPPQQACPPPACPPGGGSGFGMLDLITLATVGTATVGMVYAIDTNNQLDDLAAQIAASP